MRRLPVQDGGVEGLALSSCKSTEITTIHRRTLEPTKKKDTPCPKTKRKPEQDGRKGVIVIKSNPISAGWVTHRLENNNTKEVLTLL